MSENSLKVLSFIAFIIAASGLGVGAYSFMQARSGALKGDNGDDGEDGDDGDDGVVLRVYYKQNMTGFSCSPINTYIPINALNTTFYINSGESAYFLYTGIAKIYYDYSLSVYFLLDGNVILEPYALVSPNTGEMGFAYYPLSLQYSNSSLSEGLHEITVARNGRSTATSVSQNVLYVQIYRS